jgi:hypothetical protein
MSSGAQSSLCANVVQRSHRVEDGKRTIEREMSIDNHKKITN